MSCDYCEPRLSALADGELGAAAAWRVRRHLAHCAGCAVLYAQIERVGAAARAFAKATAAPPPADLSERVLRHLAVSPPPSPAEREAVTSPVFDLEEILMQASVLPPPVALRRPLADVLFPRALRPVAAATAVLVAAVGFGTHAFVPGKPRFAFADVRRAVQEVSTAHIRFRITPQVAGGETVQVFNAWLRTDPAGFAMLMPEGVRIVGDGTGVVIHPGKGNGEPIRVSDEKITRSVITDLLLSPGGLLGEKPGKPDSATTEWGAPEWVTGPSGARLLRFQTEKNGTRVFLWADPETQRPARIEVRTALGESSTLTEIDFSYNETPPAGTF